MSDTERATAAQMVALTTGRWPCKRTHSVMLVRYDSGRVALFADKPVTRVHSASKVTTELRPTEVAAI